MQDAQLLLLDEPSNHLDVSARQWLMSYLEQYQGALLLVSHDAGLLQAACTHVAEIAGGKVNTYSGGKALTSKSNPLRQFGTFSFVSPKLGLM